MTEFVCVFCLKPGTIRESVTIYGGSHDVTIVPSSDDPAVPHPQDGDPDSRKSPWDSTDVEGYFCTNCESAADKLADLVTSRPLFECRSCGWRGVDREEHLDSCPDKPERVDAVETHPAQEHL